MRRFTAKDIAYAIQTNLDLVKQLKENRSVRYRLKLILMPFPQVDRVAPYIKSETWLRWFIGNELKHSRPDLYPIFIYQPGAFNWLHQNMEKLSDYLFG